jgi:hypothetical protein
VQDCDSMSLFPLQIFIAILYTHTHTHTQKKEEIEATKKFDIAKEFNPQAEYMCGNVNCTCHKLISWDYMRYNILLGLLSFFFVWEICFSVYMTAYDIRNMDHEGWSKSIRQVQVKEGKQIVT